MANGNPFDTPLASEVQDHQQAQAATVQASNNGNPFSEPLMSEKAEAANAARTDGAQIAPVTTSTNPKLAVALAQKDASPAAGAVALAAPFALGGAAAAPVVATALEHLGNLDKIVKFAKGLGYGSFGLKEAHDLYKSVTGDKK